MNTTTLNRSSQVTAFAALPKTYLALCTQVLLPRPIHSRREYLASVAVAETLAGHTLTKDQDDYLNALTTFLEAWEDAHEPALPEATPLAVLRSLLEENAMSSGEFAVLLGITRSMASRILSGERQLTTKHIVTLAARFRIKPDALLPIPTTA